MLITLIAFIVAIGLLVTIHELGHYWVARWCGVYIERFSIGFGPVLFKRIDKNGCEWAVSALPLGGYVMMRDHAPAEASEAYKNSAFQNKTLTQRAAVTVAGPVANLLLAVVLYALIGLVGTQEPAAILASPVSASSASMAGINGGETVVAVNQKPVKSWTQLRWQLIDRLHTGGEVQLTLKDSDGRVSEHWLQLEPAPFDAEAVDPLQATGLALAIPAPFFQQVIEGSAAEKAGLNANDKVIAINGVAIQNAAQFVDIVKQHANQRLELSVMRQDQPYTTVVDVEPYTTDQGEVIGRIGVLLGANIEMVNVRYGPVASIEQGFSRTVDTFWLSLKMIGRMFTGEVSVKNISGPVSIADYAGQSARIGLAAYIHFLALISVSIGLLNLLPIPMLDGGHLLYYAIEAVTKRPVLDGAKLIGQRIGLLLLGMLMILAFFNDFSRLTN